MVYSKLVILAIISFVLINNSQTSLPVLVHTHPFPGVLNIMVVAAMTFVAYEGFQLVIHAMNEMENPQRNIPRAIYTAIGVAIVIYTVMSLGAVLAIPFENIVSGKEYALASGAGEVLGHWGTDLVILGAMLASSSAISGTLFGASRLMAIIAGDGYFPAALKNRRGHIPVNAIICMSVFAITLVLVGGLELILEFGSVTFLLVSLLMAYANFCMRRQTRSRTVLTVLAMVGLFCGTALIFFYELVHQPLQMFFNLGLYLALTLSAWLYSVGNIGTFRVGTDG